MVRVVVDNCGKMNGNVLFKANILIQKTITQKRIKRKGKTEKEAREKAQQALKE